MSQIDCLAADRRAIRAHTRALCLLRAFVIAGSTSRQRKPHRKAAERTAVAHDAAILRITAARRGSDVYPRARGSAAR